VLDDFPVLSMATIRNPVPLELLGIGQTYFYAIDMTRNEDLLGQEMETMRRLHIRFASFLDTKLLGRRANCVTLESLIQKDQFGFRTGLAEIMDIIGSRISSHYQIEFIFNIDLQRSDKTGTFHIVQLTQLPRLQFDKIEIPEQDENAFLSIQNFQGHGIKTGIRHAVVVSPFIYTKDMHDAVRRRISEINQSMNDRGNNYLIVVPGRLGSNNRDWGIYAEYRDVDAAVAIFEYGVDIAGRSEPVPEEKNRAGGIYGSHFLYMIQGGYDEEQKRLQTRMYGTQGTHFLTNLVGNNIIYGFIRPNEDRFDSWFFTPNEPSEAVYVLTFPNTIGLYADSITHRCVII
jgi:hypothetical protein